MTTTEDIAMDTKNECDVREMIARRNPLLDEHIFESEQIAAALEDGNHSQEVSA